MSSKQLALAYSASDRSISSSELDIRLSFATEHLQRLFGSQLVVRKSLAESTGLIVWDVEKPTCSWPSFSFDERVGSAAWLHVPTIAGSPDDNTDPVRTAFDVVTGKIDASAVGAPFGVMTLDRHGAVRIANDVFGMARVFQFDFDGLTVWSTRTGLAHIFAGVQPTVNPVAWQSMATLGWSSQGLSHMGNGRQLPPHSLTTATPRKPVEMTSGLDHWLEEENSSPIAELTDSALDMRRTLETVKHWQRRPVADLSGGKDSRVIAAAGLRADAIEAVRTVRTDHGEVETAKHLMDLIGNPVEHRVQELASPKAVSGGVAQRLLGQHQLWEGYYLARTAYRAPLLSGVRRAPSARLNGLGGEAIQGGSIISDAWRDRIVEGGFPVAEKRLVAMVRGPMGASEESRESTAETVLQMANESRRFDWKSNTSSIDYVYNFDKMPYWSNNFGSAESVLPYYSPAMLTHIAQAFNHLQPYGEMHRQLLKALIPEWANVPFYKPSQRSRATVHMWEYEDWEQAKSILHDRLELAPSFDRDSTLDILQSVESQNSGVHHETALIRALWEITFHEYVETVAHEASNVAAAVSGVRGVVEASNSH